MLNKRIFFFVCSIFLLVLQGYSLPYLLVYLFCMFLIFNPLDFVYSVNRNKTFFCGVVLAFVLATFNTIFANDNTHVEKDIVPWCAFFVIIILPMGIRNKLELWKYLKYLMLVLFIFDITTNILLFFMDLPWSQIPHIREGESFPRMPGFKGSALFSGYISIITFVLFLNKWSKNIKNKFFLLIVLFNLLLAGSFRFYVMVIICIIAYFFLRGRKMKYLPILFFIAIVSVFILTFSFGRNFGSNQIRAIIWAQSIARIMQGNPFLGEGFVAQKDIEENEGIESLLDANVTESNFISIAIAFGVMVMSIFLYYFFKTTLKIRRWEMYNSVIGVFLVEVSLLFYGGGMGNFLSGTFLGLTCAILNNENLEGHDIDNNSSIQ